MSELETMVDTIIKLNGSSANVSHLASALVQANADMPVIPMNGKNPYFSSKYATLGDVIEKTRPVLAEHGLTINQFVVSGDNEESVGVQTIILHETGEWISGTVFLPVKFTTTSVSKNGETYERETNYGQEAGKLITYLRRYALSAALNLYADEDIDSNTVSQQKGASQSARQQAEEDKHKISEAQKEAHDSELADEAALASYEELRQYAIKEVNFKAKQFDPEDPPTFKKLREQYTAVQQAIKNIKKSKGEE